MTKTSEAIIAQRYAKALHSMLAARGDVQTVAQQLMALAQAVHNTPAWRQLVQAPTLLSLKIVAKISSTLQLTDALRRLLGVLVRRRRLGLLLAVANALNTLVQQAQKVASATVYTASPLTTTQRARLSQLLQQNTGLDITLHEQVDPNLLAGFSVHYMGRAVDLSLRQQLLHSHVGIKGNA